MENTALSYFLIIKSTPQIMIKIILVKGQRKRYKNFIPKTSSPPENTGRIHISFWVSQNIFNQI